MQKSEKLGRIHLPIQRPEDVIPHLGSPGHWQPGRSAKSAADLWFVSNGLPTSVCHLLLTSIEFSEAVLVDAFLERSVDLGDGERPSQTDVMAIIQANDRLAILAVEAKVDETFGPTVSKWLAQSNGDSGKRHARLKMLCDLLGLNPDEVGDIRYQLLHRTASAIIEARRYCTDRAAMIVQSFCPKLSWFGDFQAFVAAMGLEEVAPGVMSSTKLCDGVKLQMGWVAEKVEGPFRRLNTARTVTTLTELGRIQLSKSFFMRDMLYSEVAMIHGINNAPDDPELAIKAGSKLCEELLEPLQEKWGRIAIRSAYRSCEVNGYCNEMQRDGKKGYTCANNETNYAAHIWDRLDEHGQMGAMACVVVPGFWEQHKERGDWRILARWIHESLPYSSLYFFPTYWAVNVGWHERPKRTIKSYAEPMGIFVP